MEIVEIKNTDVSYPSRLLQIKDYPKTLYALGNISLLNKELVLGMVGSRNCSEYGRNVAYSFAKELSKKEITIISGLAIGIDAASHIGSMEEKRENNCCFGVWLLSYISERKRVVIP